MDRYTKTNGIQIHFLDHAGGEPTLVFLPGLTANCHCFDGVVRAGLSPRYRVLALDLRGRGLSDKPETGYTMADHATDVIGLLDAEQIDEVILVGHSFGGLLTMYLAATHPEHFDRIVIIDAAQSATQPQVAELIKPSLDRLEQQLPSVDAYLAAMKQLPFLAGYWDEDLADFYRADMRLNEDGTARSHSTPEAIGAAIDGVVAEPWSEHLAAIQQTAVLINATGPYGPPGTPPVFSREDVLETAALIPNSRYVHVPGNHLTMLFGENAPHVVQAISDFIEETT